MEKLLVFDGNSIMNRTFYGISGPSMLRNSKGVCTNAVYGFVNILFKYLNEEDPDYICVAFDLKGPTFRHGSFSDYKAGRRVPPDDLISQQSPGR